ncbi:MAG: hypothetical protein JWO98_155 [Frankiales bacterium]|nr:hypothetical protein [Frankiales bacterium]
MLIRETWTHGLALRVDAEHTGPRCPGTECTLSDYETASQWEEAVERFKMDQLEAQTLAAQATARSVERIQWYLSRFYGVLAIMLLFNLISSVITLINSL